jgi:hypothetical protein
MKRNFINLLLLICPIIVLAQPTQEQIDIARAEMMYWQLRGRLVGDDQNLNKFSGFTSVGPNNGQSLVFEMRFPNTDRKFWEFGPFLPPSTAAGVCNSQFGGTVPTTFVDPREGTAPKGVLFTGENPLIQQGWYLAVLSTEWALLNKQGQSTADVERELFFALEALNRLDRHAEELYGINNSLPNGLLARDDIKETYAIDNLGKQWDLVSSNDACPKMWDQTSMTPLAFANEFKRCSGAAVSITDFKTKRIRINVMSQDEVGGVLFGMMFVRKFVSPSANFNGINLVDLNAQICSRILKATKNSSLTLIQLPGTSITNVPLPGQSGLWVIGDPNGKAVCYGADAFAQSYGLAKMGNFIQSSGNFPLAIMPFDNGISLSVGRIIYKSYLD